MNRATRDKIILTELILLSLFLTWICPCDPLLNCHLVTASLTLSATLAYILYINYIRQ